MLSHLFGDCANIAEEIDFLFQHFSTDLGICTNKHIKHRKKQINFYFICIKHQKAVNLLIKIRKKLQLKGNFDALNVTSVSLLSYIF